jgi:NAD(P)-dependent dehydrogenase (short-subunit alcohol dehydrogenase family)
LSDFTGKTVLITGAAGGIGAACAASFADAEANVVLADVMKPEAALLAKLPSEGTLVVEANISLNESVRAMIDAAVSRFGSLDVLVNNAAALWPAAPVQDTTIDELDRIIAVNVRGTFLCCKHAYEHLRRAKGSIVNVSSMAGVHGEKHHAAYGMTKGALNALTHCMAIDWGPDIRVNAVCPSSVVTPNVDKVIDASPDPEAIRQLRRTIHFRGEPARPEEIASVVRFLASRDASYITGAVMPVSGGSECGYGVKY